MRHLSLLVALADHGTTHSAADALNMTQSTASKMLRDVEETYQAVLFERGPRGMQPTPLGRFAVDNARAQLSRLQRFSEEFSARRLGGYGTLAVGAITGAAPDLVARAVAEIKARRPQLSVTLHGETSDGILAELEAGRLDLAVGRFSAERHRTVFAFEPLAEERLVFVARVGHAQAHGARRLEDLQGCTWALQPDSNPSRQALDAAFDRAGLRRPADSIECSSILLMLNLVMELDVVALLPEAVVRVHRQTGLVGLLDIRPEVRLSGFGLVTRRREPLQPAALEFCEILRGRARR
jgi:DNA-binding transcriptional LysR family regulator